MLTKAKVGIMDYPPEKPLDRWNNYDNIPFYEEAASGLLQKFAVIGGLDTCCDMQIAYPFIKNCHSILEVGAGYGRILEFLIAQDYQGEIFAIERSFKFKKILQTKFKDKINFFFKDLNSFFPNRKFEAILWMWSGISDFSQTEQLKILENLSNNLEENGILVLDTLIHTEELKNESYSIKQSYIIQKNNFKAYGYKPSPEEIELYARKLQFKNINHRLKYRTSTNRFRNLHFLFK